MKASTNTSSINHRIIIQASELNTLATPEVDIVSYDFTVRDGREDLFNTSTLLFLLIAYSSCRILLTADKALVR